MGLSFFTLRLTYGASLDSSASSSFAGSVFSVAEKGMIAAMTDSGALTCRYQIEWSGIERTQGVYDWSIVDDLVTTCQTNGFLIDFVVQNAPTWRTQTQAIDATKTVPKAQDTADFLTLLLTRYGAGVFYSIEIGNEGFNASALTSLNASALFTQLFSLLQASNTVIRSMSPTTRIGAPADLNQNTVNISAWINGFYAANCHTLVDFLNIHYYNGTSGPDNPANGQSSFLQWVQTFHSVSVANNDPARPIWITETGWGFGTVGDTTNAQYISTLLNYAYSSADVQKVIYYNLGGIAPGTGVNQNFTTQSYQAWKNFISTH